MKMRTPWLSLCFIVLTATSCGFLPLFKHGNCPAMDGGGSGDDFCYCSALVNPPLRICPASPLTDPYVSDALPLETDTSPQCMLMVGGGNGYCVIAATTIKVNTTVHATGRKPLVIIASESIEIDKGGVIDVGSHLGEESGAGAEDCMPGTLKNADQGGGGAGGSFIRSGGSGGDGAGPGSGSGGSPASPDADVMHVPAIRGGCAGQDGGGASPGLGGRGGGAVFLIANNEIYVNGAILAGGAGGGGGMPTDGMTKHSGGGGGGAGGMIGLEANLISVTGVLVANGGGGGEGAGSPPDDPSPNNLNGNGGAGADATATVPACGGTGGTKDAGGGGCGSPGCMEREGSCDSPVPPAAPVSHGYGGGSASGGGGGGGGAGLITVHGSASASLGGQVSPPPTP